MKMRIHVQTGLISALCASLLGAPSQAEGAPPSERPPLAGYSAPEWYKASRIHAHTRIAPRAFKENPHGDTLKSFLFTRGKAWEDAYKMAASGMKDLGVSVFTRHAKTQDEAPPWDTNAPFPHKAPIGDQITPMVADAAQAGRRMLLYYWDIGDRLALEANPDWACKNQDATPVGHAVKGPYLDIASGYGALVQQRLQELHSFGPDGIYLDFRHYPPKGCYMSHTEALFRQNNPDFSKMDRTEAAFWDAFQPFQAKMMARVIHSWTSSFRDDPSFAPLVSVTSLPALPSREMTPDLARTGIPKTEYHVAHRQGVNEYVFRYNPDLWLTAPSHDIRMAYGWTFLAELSGSAPHVWINGLPTWDQAMLAVGAIITFGGVANVDIDERNITTATDHKGVTPRALLKSIYGMDKTVGPLFADARPLRFAALHFADGMRDQVALRDRWTDVAHPSLRAFEELERQQIPVTIVDDRMLEEGDLTGLTVISASPLGLTDKARRNLTAQDVSLVEIPKPSVFVLDTEDYYKEALKEVSSLWSGVSALKVSLGDENAFVRVWERETGDWIVSMVRPFSDVQTQQRSRPLEEEDIWHPDAASQNDVVLDVKWPDGSPKLCASDPFTKRPLEMDQNRLILPGPQMWRLAVIAPCT